MATDTPRCKACGQELTGRDVYEATCKSCRAEAVLGAPAPAKQARPSAPPPPLPAKSAADPDPGDRIALETSAVDLEADTKEIQGMAAALAVPAACGAPAAEPSPAAEAEPPASDAPADDHTIRFTEGNAEAKPDLQSAIRHSSRPRTQPAPASSAPAPTGGSRDAGAARWPAMDRPATGDESANLLSLRLEGDAAAEARPNRISAPAPPPQSPARPSTGTDRPDLAEEREPAPPSPKPPLPSERKPEPPPHRVAPVPTLEFPEPESEPEPRDRQAPPRGHPTRPEPPPAEAVVIEAPASAPPKPQPLHLGAEKTEGRLQALLEQMSGQVEQISIVLADTRRAAPSPFWFGFRAFFGFVLGAGALAVVAVGLLAVAGLLFYRPAFEFLRRVLGQILGS